MTRKIMEKNKITYRLITLFLKKLLEKDMLYKIRYLYDM
jgi:hypothetical protein